MIIHNKPLSWYVEKLARNEYFSQGMYGDGEWEAIFGEKIGKTNAEGTIYTPELCEDLAKSLEFKAENFIFSSPYVLKRADWTGIGEEKIDNYLQSNGLNIEFYEKDIWNDAMVKGDLAPLIGQLRKMNVVIISNKALRELNFLKYDHFIEISYPNCYDEVGRVVNEVMAYGKEGVYCISAGLPATLIIQQLHNRIPHSFFLDLGSIWDTFAGIGSQRGFRNELYQNHFKYAEWWRKNLNNVYEHTNI